MRHFFYIFFACSLGLVAGCQVAPSSPVALPQQVAIEDIEVVEEDVFVPVSGNTDVNISTLIGAGVNLLEDLDADFDGDGVMEKVVRYVNPSVVAKKGEKPRKIEYVDVYRFDGKVWERIKRDEVTNEGGVVDSKFCVLDVVNLGDDKAQDLLTGKCHGPHGYFESYNIFGMTASGVFDDFAVPKAYLHADQYLRKGQGDLYLDFQKPEIGKEGITETYGVFCNSRDTDLRGGTAFGGYCRDLTIFIPFNSENKTFGQRVVKEDKPAIYSELYSNMNLGTSFDLPVWLEVTDIEDDDGGKALRLRDKNPKFSGHEYMFLFTEKSEELLELFEEAGITYSDEALQDTAKRRDLLNQICQNSESVELKVFDTCSVINDSTIYLWAEAGTPNILFIRFIGAGPKIVVAGVDYDENEDLHSYFEVDVIESIVKSANF